MDSTAHPPHKVDIIIPTYSNIDQALACVASMRRCKSDVDYRIIIINNGSDPLERYVEGLDVNVLLVEAEENLGWEGGLARGLGYSYSEFVVFANDDIYIPTSETDWLEKLIGTMERDSTVGAVGPSSNVVMGFQNIWYPPFYSCVAKFLVGFCMAVRRSALDQVGGVDCNLPGGDDIDLSIRLRKAGHRLVIRKDTFVYHHGFQTGTRVFGGQDKAGGWNSREMTDRTNEALIQKHGFLAWWDTMTQHEHVAYVPMESDIIAQSCAINNRLASALAETV